MPELVSDSYDHDACEVCGHRATRLVADAREMEPAIDGDGRKWRAWEIVSRHAFCEAHYREPRDEYLPTTTPDEIAVTNAMRRECQIVATAGLLSKVEE